MSRRKKRTPKEQKHKYSSQDIVYSSGWCTADYRLADKQRDLERDQRKKQNAESFGVLLELIHENQIRSLSKFTEMIYKNHPNLSTVLLQYYSNIRDYIRSYSNDKLEEDIRKSYEEYKELKQKYQDKFEDFQREMEEKIAFKETQISDLLFYIDRITKSPEDLEDLQRIKDDWNDFAKDLDSFELLEFEKIL